MSNPGMKMTLAGRRVLARGLIGEEIYFTKVAFGDGDFDYETERVLDLTALRNWRMDLPIVDKRIPGDGKATIVAQLTNFHLDHGFAAKEIGIFALDQETDTEILYAYRNAGDEYNYIPANTGPVAKNIRYAYNVEIGDAENVTFNIDFSFAYVSMDDFLKVKTKLLEVNRTILTSSANDLGDVIDGTYRNSGENGADETSGIPTYEDIQNIIAGDYIHYVPRLDEFAVEAPTEDFIYTLISA